jgi:hypothetical protein
VHSGYRSKEVNDKIPNASKHSQHMKGEAVDFHIEGVPNMDVAQWVRDKMQFDQLILENTTPGVTRSGWVHCSFKTTGNRPFVKGNINKKVVTKFKTSGVYYDYLQTERPSKLIKKANGLPTNAKGPLPKEGWLAKAERWLGLQN